MRVGSGPLRRYGERNHLGCPDFETVDRLEGHTSDIFDAAFDPDRRELAAAGGEGSVEIWNVETGLPCVTLPALEAISDIACSPDGRYLAAVIPEGFVTMYILDVDEVLTGPAAG